MGAPKYATPPHAAEAEAAVLAACLNDPDAVVTAVDMLGPEHFYSEANRRVFHVVADLFQRAATVDPVTVSEALQRRGELEAVGGMGYVAELVDAAFSARTIEDHARIIRDRWLLREVIARAKSVASRAADPGDRTALEVADEAVRELGELAASEGGEGLVWAKRLIYPVIEAFEKRAGGASITGTPSGLHDLDDMTAGFQRGDMIVLAARPSMGKTAAATGFALHAAIAQKTPVAMFVYEGTKEQIVERMLCHEAFVDLHAFRKGQLSDSAYVRIAQAASHLNSAPIYISDDASLTVPQVRAQCRRLKTQYPNLGLVILDYLQLMPGVGKAENRQQEVSQLSRAIKLLAKDLDAPVIALSQLSRAPEQRSDHRPQLSDLRESGSLEQDADVVMFVYRPERYLTPVEAEEKGLVGKAELIIAKQRNGPTGTVELFFRKECARFESYTHRAA